MKIPVNIAGFGRAVLVVVGVSLLSMMAFGGPAPVRSRAETPPFRMIGTPRIDDIDQAVRKVMAGGGVHGASLAIVSGTRLVFAKGYTLGPPSTPLVGPTTYFRQASVSKLITSLAIMQLVDEGKLTLGTRMQSILHLRAPGGRPPKDPRFGDITIRNLLDMDSGLDPALGDSDAAIAAAVGKTLPVDVADLETYAAGETLAYKPGDKSRAAYNNSNFDFLAYIVAKLRGEKSFADAIRKPLLTPLHITRIRGAESLRSQQLPGEATYYPNPYATARSVMSPNQPTVELGYGDENFSLFQGGGGMSAAATDMARLLAAFNLERGNPAFSAAALARWLKYAYTDLHDHAYTGSEAFGFFGFDGLGPVAPSSAVPPYEGDKGGYLETSQNVIYFQSGVFAYVLCFSGHTGHDSNWYPSFAPVISTMERVDWSKAPDLFPMYGMPSFETTMRKPGRPGAPHLQFIDPKRFFVH